jgi:hypothetical protein
MKEETVDPLSNSNIAAVRTTDVGVAEEANATPLLLLLQRMLGLLLLMLIGLFGLPVLLLVPLGD